MVGRDSTVDRNGFCKEGPRANESSLGTCTLALCNVHETAQADRITAAKYRERFERSVLADSMLRFATDAAA